MQEPEPPVIEPFVFTFSWRRFLVHCVIMAICIALGLMTWYFGKAPSVRFYETKSEQQITAAISPDIEMVLAINSSVAIKEGQPLQAELFAGSVYFDIKKDAAEKLEVKVDNAIIKDFGTRFSIEKSKSGNHHIAVADGYIKIYVASGVYRINAHEQADFDDVKISKHRLVTEHSIAPWRAQPQ